MQKSQPEINAKTKKIETYFLRGKVKFEDQHKLTTSATGDPASLGKDDYGDRKLLPETMTEPGQVEARTSIKTHGPQEPS